MLVLITLLYEVRSENQQSILYYLSKRNDKTTTTKQYEPPRAEIKEIEQKE